MANHKSWQFILYPAVSREKKATKNGQIPFLCSAHTTMATPLGWVLASSRGTVGLKWAKPRRFITMVGEILIFYHNSGPLPGLRRSRDLPNGQARWFSVVVIYCCMSTLISVSNLHELIFELKENLFLLDFLILSSFFIRAAAGSGNICHEQQLLMS